MTSITGSQNLFLEASDSSFEKDNALFKSNTPCSAQGVKFPETLFTPVSSLIFSKIFFKLAGIFPDNFEKASP